MPKHGERPITLQDLSTHVSGLPSLPDNFQPADATNPYADFTVDQMYEFLKGYTGSPFELDRDSDIVIDYEAIIRFLKDVDVLFHECQYTQEEYLKKIGWGHSSVPNACSLVKLCNARRWIVIHHDPMHNDEFLQRKLNLTRQLVHDLGHEIEVSHGFDGWCEYL